MGLLTFDQIMAVYADASGGGLADARSVLLAGFTPEFRVTLEGNPVPGTQLLLDLQALNERPVRIAGLLPLQMWLRTGAALLAARLPASAAKLAALAEALDAQPVAALPAVEAVASQAIETVSAAAAADPRLGVALAEVRDDLKYLAGRLRLLAARKNLDDVLHQLEIDKLPAMQASLYLVDTPIPTSALRTQYSLQTALTNLRQVADTIAPQRRDRAAADRLVDDLARIDAAMRGAVDARAVAPLRLAVLELRGLLKAAMGQLAYGLSTDETIEIENAAQNLRGVAAKLPAADPSAIQLREAASKLFALSDELRPLLREHYDWQLVDDNLWVAEENMLFGEESALMLDRFSSIWPQVVAGVTTIAGAAPEAWFVRTGGHATAFAVACPIPARSPISPAARDEFGNFIAAARQQFYVADCRLRERCDRLAEMAVPLESWADTL